MRYGDEHHLRTCASRLLRTDRIFRRTGQRLRQLAMVGQRADTWPRDQLTKPKPLSTVAGADRGGDEASQIWPAIQDYRHD